MKNQSIVYIGLLSLGELSFEILLVLAFQSSLIKIMTPCVIILKFIEEERKSDFSYVDFILIYKIQVKTLKSEVQDYDAQQLAS